MYVVAKRLYCKTIGRFIAMALIFGLLVLANISQAKPLQSSWLIDNTINPTTVKEPFEFFGLALYYNNVNYYLIDLTDIQPILDDSTYRLNKGQWLAAVGRFNVLLVNQEGIQFSIIDQTLVFDPNTLPDTQSIQLTNKSQLKAMAPELDVIRYYHLWAPLAALCRMIEAVLNTLHPVVGSSWGLTIVLFSVLLKLLLVPVSIMTVRFQRHVSQIQSQLAPKLRDIKNNYDGEQAHEKLMAAHKELGVTPFYTLKPMLGSLIQIPILIAVFNALGEMPNLQGQAFLWIDDLAYPDQITSLSFTAPMFGSTLSLLPFVMTFLTIFSTIIYQNPHAPVLEVKRQKRNLYLMALAFFILFYPFPAVMVLYWTLANLLQTIQQQIIKI